MFNNKHLIITGNNASFGNKCTRIVLRNYKLKKEVIF